MPKYGWWNGAIKAKMVGEDTISNRVGCHGVDLQRLGDSNDMANHIIIDFYYN